MKAHYLTLSGSARLAREITADPSRVHCEPPWSCWLSWHCPPSRTADRLLRALLRISPLQCFFNIAAFFPSVIRRHGETKSSSKNTCICLTSPRSTVAAIAVLPHEASRLGNVITIAILAFKRSHRPSPAELRLPQQSRSGSKKGMKVERLQ